MDVRFQSASAPLAEFVECLWYWDGTTPGGRERVLPTGAAQLIFDLSDHKARILCGPRSQPVEIDLGGNQQLLGIYFKPGGLARFCQPPAGEFHNEQAPLDEVWSNAPELSERLLGSIDSRGASSAFTMLNGALDSRLRNRAPRRPEVAFILRELQRNGGPPSMAEITNRIGMSQRRLIELFRDEVSMTPKRFARIQRFNRTLLRIDRRPDPVDWADLAVANGYYDQSHLIQDFHEFAGFTPRAYIERRGHHATHVSLDD